MLPANSRPSLTGVAALAVAASLGMAACVKPKPVAETATPSPQEKLAARAAVVPKPVQDQWTILNRIRQDESLSIGRTMLDDQNQLGVVLAADVAPEKVEGIMRTVLTEMAHDFPKEDVTVGVFQSANPPRKIGVAHLDGKTEEATYTPR